MMIRAAWLAIAWIAFETLLGWILATRARRAGAAPASTAQEKASDSSRA
jgi:hypothetical protein